MALVELILPKMGEGIIEATILKWVKNVGDEIKEDEIILEVATDKVDSEVPSPISGTISKILFKENDVVPIGATLAIIATEGTKDAEVTVPHESSTIATTKEKEISKRKEQVTAEPVESPVKQTTGKAKFFSPLVKSIAKKENITNEELESIIGTGAANRITKNDILNYLKNRNTNSDTAKKTVQKIVFEHGDTEIVEMDRMRKLIADHMVMSKQVSPHVTSVVEADVTNLVNWRNDVKEDFQKKYGEKITFTPIFVEAVIKALKDFPMVNVSVDGTKIIIKKHLNIGIATALPTGNLIVPVIKNAESKNLLGLTKSINDLATRGRNNKLTLDEIQGGTFTITNLGTFGNILGTPIINQPQVAILALGAIRKKPAVLETEYGDVIAIRQMCYLSLSYDHRVVDGVLGGTFLKKIADYLESFDGKRSI